MSQASAAKTRRAFTLLELSVSIIAIAVLVGAVVSCVAPDVGDARAQTRSAANLRQIANAHAINDAFVGGGTPWSFNHGLDSEPVAVFFDGSVRTVGCRAAMVADERLAEQARSERSRAPTGGDADRVVDGSWSRTTPLGATGYFGAHARDGAATSFHILTVNGIQGRDVLDAR